ncbi:MAG: histidine phosphatase family protein [Planctomycetota bacterium]|nr:histidine phosphatase family protein [Planctomycetaceae bacterium]MDQ3331424.1 histidine phosphatase family protein [Planctomycetota bacterium]
MTSSPLSHKTLLYLVRHGATAANERRPYVLQGSGVDNPLSATGESQAESVARLLSRIPLAAVYCSRMRRAAQTATAIASRHAFEPTPLDSIHEVDVGQWEGLSWIDIEARHREQYDAFIASPGTVAYLGGESYANVLTRAEPIFTSLFRRHVGERIAVVAHNVVNRAYLSHLLGLDINLAKNIEQTNTCVNVIEWDHERERGSLLTLNANFHVPGVLE